MAKTGETEDAMGTPPMNDKALETLALVLEEMHEGLCITDGDGVIVWAGKSCVELYGIHNVQSYVGKHISVLEEEGIFSPALSLIALRERRKVAMTQPDSHGRPLLVTATPIFDAASGDILFVVSYASWDSANLPELQSHYNQLQKEIARSNLELGELKKKLLSVDLVARSDKMQQITRFAQRISGSDVEVLLLGEAGSGKSNFAKYLHKLSKTPDQPFGHMSCSAFSGDILEGELFGYVKVNTQTGEEVEKAGLCEILHGGTLFLEDIEGMNRETQATLLYMLKNKHYYKRNSKNPVPADVRLVASSRKSEAELAEALLEGLYYRLSMVKVEVPPLRQRREDIPHLVRDFLAQYNEKYQTSVSISPKAMTLLELYHWPGNVTQLKYMLQQMVLTVEGDVIQTYHLPEAVSPFSAAGFDAPVNLRDYLEFYEQRLVQQAYKKCGTTVALAKYLGISQASAVRKLQKYALSKNE